MEASKIKDLKQREGLNEWYKQGCKGTLELATGVGKTRCGVIAGSYFAEQHGYEYKILIVTPTEVIRDTVWENEFKKWKKSLVWTHCVEIVCIQTAYKWINRHYDLVILDEVHRYLPTFEDFQDQNYEYFKIFENNTFDKILGLSASIDASRRLVLNKIAKVVYRITLRQAKQLGLVSGFKIYNLPVYFTEAEQKEYFTINNAFEERFSLMSYNDGIGDLNFLWKFMKDKKAYYDFCVERGYNWNAVKDYPIQCIRLMSDRKQLLIKAINKVNTTREITMKFPDRIGIVFSGLTEVADDIQKSIGDTCVTFHSKLSKTVRAGNLKRLNDGRTKIKTISTVKALNEGINIPVCSLAIITFANSTARDLIQTVGRVIRWEEDKTAIIIRLYVPGTQEEKWMRNAQLGQDVININNLNEIDICL